MLSDTSHTPRRVLLAACALLTAWSAPAVADACSSAPCDYGSHTPGDQALVPTNLPGIFWRTDDDADATIESVRLVRVADEQDIPLEVVPHGNGRHTLKLLEALAPDADHTLVLGSICEGTGLADDTAPQYAIKTTAEHPLPAAELGDLIVGQVVHGDVSLASIDGGCAAPVDSVYVDIQVAHATDVEPWIDALLYETLVDGKLWRPSGFLPENPPEGESWRGRGVDRVFATCETVRDVIEDGVAEGLHKIVMRARIPATDLVLATTTVEVLLTCPEAETTGGDTSTGDPSTTSADDTGATVTSDPGDTQATSTDPPATTTDPDDPTGDDPPTGTGDPASTGTTDPPVDDDDGAGGCTCSATPRDPVAPMLALIVLGLARRRRT